MKKWLKRIRGAVGMGLTWAAAWAGVGTILWMVALVLGGAPAYAIVGYSGLFALLGFLAGATFSLVLGIAGRRRRFDEMSLPRFAFWGTVGGVLLSIFFILGGGGVSSASLLTYSIVTLLGAGSAGGSLALARMADDRELLDAGADVGDIGLTQEEKHALLGE